MPSISLFPLTEEAMSAILADIRGFEARQGLRAGDYASQLIEHVQQTRNFGQRVGAMMPWGGYLAIHGDTKTIVGICGFKGNPDAEGFVEIAYATFRAYEGRGYATEMARGMLEIALQSQEVSMIVAHTLPERNASGRILQKVGMSFVGEVINPDDGLVWRWELRKPGRRS